MPTVTELFLAASRQTLSTWHGRIEKCLRDLTPEQIWFRANDASNSIGNLLLHLAGSSRYWAVEVIGGQPVGRNRQQEFDRREPLSPDRLLA